MNTVSNDVIIHGAAMTLVLIIVVRVILAQFFTKEKLKRIHRVLRIVFTVIIIPWSLVCIGLATAAEVIEYSSLWTYYWGNELLCYSVISMAYLATFYALAKRIRLPLRLVLSAVGAILFTAEVFVVNNLLHTARYWCIPPRDISFAELFRMFAEYDLKYSFGLGIFRYVLVFLFQLTLLVIASVFADPKIRASVMKKTDRIRKKLYYRASVFFDGGDLLRLTDAYYHNLIEYKVIEDYLKKAKYDGRFMYELIRCVKKYGITEYSFVLFSKYKDRLTKNQYIDQRELFLENSELALPVECHELDKKFGLDCDGVCYVDYDALFGRLAKNKEK